MRKKWLALFLSVLLLAGCARMPERPGESETSEVTEPSTSPVSEESTAEPIPETTESPETEPVPPPISEYVEESLRSELSAVEHAFVYDPSRGFLLCLGDPYERVYPASTTKLVTALVALDCLQPDTVLTAGKELNFVMQGASIAWIAEGQRLTVEMLVEAMLLPSGCDAAYVLAAGAGRQCFPDCADAAEAIDVFVGMMNDWSARRGLTGSHWENPDGNHGDGHYSSIADLCRIAQLAMENETVRRYCALQSDRVVYADGATNAWSNTNLLLSPESTYYSEACVGLKTGHTAEAGYCLLSAFRTDDGLLFAGVFGCPTTGERFRVSDLLYRHYTEAQEDAAA